MSSISDPGKAGRGDRRRAQKLIDAAYATGQLTAADRALRTDRVRSAHTKGDLVVLVRDLNHTSDAGSEGSAAVPPVVTTTQGTTSLGSAIPPEQLSAMVGSRSARAIRLGDSLRTIQGDGIRKVRRVVLIILISFVVMCGLGIAAVVGLIVSGVDQAMDSTDPTSSVSLQTAEGWTELVAAVEDETGTSRVYDAVVYPEYASLNALVDEGAMRYIYRNGTFQLFNSPVTPAVGEPVDLADIDGDLIEELPDRTAERSGMPEYESVYLIVRTMTGDPTISVYLQQTGRLSRWTVYDLDGTVVGGSPS
ncbi:MAG: DUF1707 SHOCT-like domain-containing protein [Aeromicrobium sp.]